MESHELFIKNIHKACKSLGIIAKPEMYFSDRDCVYSATFSYANFAGVNNAVQRVILKMFRDSEIVDRKTAKTICPVVSIIYKTNTGNPRVDIATIETHIIETDDTLHLYIYAI